MGARLADWWRRLGSKDRPVSNAREAAAVLGLEQHGPVEKQRRTIRDPDIWEAIAASEGGSGQRAAVRAARWLEDDERFQYVRNARAHLMRGDPEEAVIYGLDGLHRYFIRHDGEVVYSRTHGETGVASAEAAGFRVV